MVCVYIFAILFLRKLAKWLFLILWIGVPRKLEQCFYISSSIIESRLKIEQKKIISLKLPSHVLKCKLHLIARFGNGVMLVASRNMDTGTVCFSVKYKREVWDL